MTAQELKEAGFTALAEQVEKVADRKRRLTLAYEFYRYASAEQVGAFQLKLKESTFKVEGQYPSAYHIYDTLKFTPIDQWSGQTTTGKPQGAPPQAVLDAVKEAKDRGIFDTLEVAHIETQRIYADPIVFGRIDGCTDAFYICEWGDDVSIRDIIAEHDG